MKIPCWLKFKRHRWSDQIVLQAPTRYALMFECADCGSVSISRSRNGDANADLTRLGYDAFIAQEHP